MKSHCKLSNRIANSVGNCIVIGWFYLSREIVT